MDYSFIAIMAVVVMVCIGLVFGFILASADKKFAMEENPLIGEVKKHCLKVSAVLVALPAVQNMQKLSSLIPMLRRTSAFPVRQKLLKSSLN